MVCYTSLKIQYELTVLLVVFETVPCLASCKIDVIKVTFSMVTESSFRKLLAKSSCKHKSPQAITSAATNYVSKHYKTIETDVFHLKCKQELI
jgi:hypothetical protein